MRQRLEPNRKLFQCFSDIEGYEGWMIGRMSFYPTGQAGTDNGSEGQGNRQGNVILKKRRQGYAVAEAWADGCLARMLLIRPTGRGYRSGFSGKQEGENLIPDWPENNRIGTHTFSPDEIMAFVDAVQDTNSIHRTERPVVPGMQMIEWFWSVAKPAAWKECVFIFRIPAYAGQEIQLYTNKAGYCCIAGETGETLWDVDVVPSA